MRALVVDDEEDLRKILSAKFTKGGWDVTTAEDGEKALEELRKAPYDLLLLDLRMPHKSGFDVLTELKDDKNIKHPVVLVLSVSGEEQDLKRAIELGAIDYFVKSQDPLEKILKWADIYTGRVPAVPGEQAHT